MWQLAIVSYLCLLTPTFALPHDTRSALLVKERHPVPPGWQLVSEAANDEVIELQLALRSRSVDAVEQHLEQIADPANIRYGQHLRQRDVQDLIAPADETLAIVQAWLRSHGIEDEEHQFSSARDWVTVAVTIEKAEAMLATTYSRYRHTDGVELLRTTEWSLPAHLHNHIEVVQPTTSFLRPMPKDAFMQSEPALIARQEAARELQNPELKGCAKSGMTPHCIRALYGTLDYKTQAADQNSVAHANFLNETSYRKDIKKFLARYRPAIASVADTFPIRVIANADNDQGPYTQEQYNALKNIEGTMDSQIIISNSWPTPFEAVNVGGLSPFIKPNGEIIQANEPWIRFLNYLLERDDPPRVISISYGEDEQTLPESLARKVCSMFAQLGARGVSVLTSSGDGGVGWDGSCRSNDGKKTRKFLPHFLASCPWVTAVGATQGFEPEIATVRFGSGGGFSDYFPAPAYQRATVSSYVAGLDGLYDGLYNKAGRGYPDVSAQGSDVRTVWGGNFEYGGGTSAAAPIWASVIALVNDALLAEGKPPLGFLNPWLYSQARETLNDVTEGSSFGCRTDGFPAKGGWDAVTGLGTPNFSKLKDAAFASAGIYGE